MSSMATDEKTTRETMRAQLQRYLERAASTDPDEALTDESPLSWEVSGKYINTLLMTGGPHAEFTFEYEDAQAAEYWYEYEPVGAWFTYKDWFVREDLYIGADDATRIANALNRSYDSLEPDED